MPVRTTATNQVMAIILDSPERLNSFTAVEHQQLHAALVAAADPDIRAVVLTGSGRGFSAGQDLGQLAGGTTVEDLLRIGFNPNILSIHNLGKPVVAAINGVTAGAGISLAAACDVRIAARETRFVAAFPDIGLVPDAGATYFLPRIVGAGRAFEWLSSGRRLEADEALAWGLISEIVDADGLLSRASEIARVLANKPGLAVPLTKHLLDTSWRNTLSQQLEAEVNAQVAAADHPAHSEAVGRFLNRAGK